MADLYQSKFYKIWANMKSRCNNKNYSEYSRYGGRGISYDIKWQTFGGFFDDMYDGYIKNVELFGEKNTTIDRTNNNGNYSKENCRWASPQEQAINRVSTKFIEYAGLKMTLVDWAKKLNIKRSTLSQRYYTYKWSIDRCFNK